MDCQFRLLDEPLVLDPGRIATCAGRRRSELARLRDVRPDFSRPDDDDDPIGVDYIAEIIAQGAVRRAGTRVAERPAVLGMQEVQPVARRPDNDLVRDETATIP